MKPLFYQGKLHSLPLNRLLEHSNGNRKELTSTELFDVLSIAKRIFQQIPKKKESLRKKCLNSLLTYKIQTHVSIAVLKVKEKSTHLLQFVSLGVIVSCGVSTIN